MNNKTNGGRLLESVECLEKKLRKKTEALKLSEKRHRTLLTLLQHTTDGALSSRWLIFMEEQKISGTIRVHGDMVSLNDPDHVFCEKSDEYLKRVEESERQNCGF